MISKDAPGKPELRRHFRALRQGVEPRQREQGNARICRLILGHPWITGARVIAAYWSFDGEPDISAALAALHGQGKIIALPRTGDRISWVPWTPGSEMRDSRLGIFEPAGSPLSPDVSPDLLLIPLVAWDDSGTRLGMGGGFYDRMLADNPATAGSRRIGIAWSAQQAKSLPRESHDQALDAVLTERGWTVISC